MSYLATYSTLLVLLLFFSAQALPFKPPKAARNRGDVFTHWNLNNIKEANNPAQPEGTPRESPSRGYILDGGCSCYHDENMPPADMLMKFRDIFFSEPHPMLILSQMAEYIHQTKSCLSLRDGIYSKQFEEETVADVRNTMLHNLNGNAAPGSNMGPCPSWYNVTFHPNRYPRYLVEVVCSDPSNDPPLSARSCSYCTDDKATTQRSGHCYSYHLRDMLVLTKDPNEPGCELPDGTPPTWQKCSLSEVGVGCKCL